LDEAASTPFHSAGRVPETTARDAISVGLAIHVQLLGGFEWNFD